MEGYPINTTTTKVGRKEESVVEISTVWLFYFTAALELGYCGSEQTSKRYGNKAKNTSGQQLVRNNGGFITK